MTGNLGVVILGMGRSGTSAVTGMFASTGFFAGRGNDLMPATESNPAGHWENMEIWRANEQILDRLGGSWFDPPPPAVQLAAREWAIPALRVEVERIVEQAHGAPIAIKDPRIGGMMALWRPVLEDRFHPVLVIRDPVEIALSLARRDGTPPAFALAAWELHMTALLDALDGRIVTVAPYARLVEDSQLGSLVVEQAAAHVDPSRANRVQPADASGALERGFRHNHAATGDHDEQLTSRQLELWQLLSSLSVGDQSIAAPAVLRLPSAAARARVRSETERVQHALDLTAQHARGDDLEMRLASEHEQATALARQLAAEQERAASSVATLTDEQQRSASLSVELATERERANAATAAHLQAGVWLAAIQGSASWRITAPLRAVKHALSRRPNSQNRTFRRLPLLARLAERQAPSMVRVAPLRNSGRLSSQLARRRLPTAKRYEIHIPISPTPTFLTRIHYLAASLRRFGGALADSPIIVTVGGDERVDLASAHPWSRRLGVEWRWLDDALWRRHGIYATALQRFCYDIEAPNALLLDADTLFIRPIDDLLGGLERSRAIAGLIAHVSPFIGCEGEQGLWEQIFHAAGLESPSLECEHPGWQVIEFDPTRRYCPPYFNLGVLLAPREVLNTLAQSIYSEMETVERVHPTLFRCQLALTLAIMRSGVQWRQLPLRFNFPNIAQYLPRHQAEFADVRIIHYLKDEEFSRAEDFASVERVGALLSHNGLNPVNARLRDTLRQVHENVLSEA